MTPSRAAQMPTEKAGRTKVCCFRLWFCVQRGACSSYSEGGGSRLGRRRIQTPSDATVLSVVQPEGEVVLGASPPARRLAQRGGGPVGPNTGARQSRAPFYWSAAQALPRRPAAQMTEAARRKPVPAAF